MLSLEVDDIENWRNDMVGIRLLPWLLTSVPSVEVMEIDIRGYLLPPLSHMTALRHLAVYDYDGVDWDTSLSPLKSLQSLKLIGMGNYCTGGDSYVKSPGIDLCSLHRLEWLKLSYLLPVCLHIPSSCRACFKFD